MKNRSPAITLGFTSDSGGLRPLLLCCAAAFVLGAVPVFAAPGLGPDVDQVKAPQMPTEFRVVSDYDTLREAKGRAAMIDRAGGTARVRKESRRVTLFNLRVGTYATRRQAQRAHQHLQRRGVKSELLGNSAGGYFVSVGAFSERVNAALLRSRLEAMGFDNTYVVPLGIVKSHYVVEQRVTRTSAAAGDTGDATPVDQPVTQSGDGPYDGGTAKPAASTLGTLQSQLPSNLHLGFGMDTLRVETGWLADLKEPVTGSHYVRASAHAEMKIGYKWDFRLGGRVDGYYQQGTPGINQAQLDYAPSYIRYEGLNTRITVGAQRVIWGRMDSFPPNDRLSVQDLSRFVLYRMAWRRRSVPEIRVERYFGNFKADVLWQPFFRPAKLPSPNSIWYPVDRVRGRVISVKSNPTFAQLIKEGKFANDVGGAGGVGVRLSGSAMAVDYAVSIQRARRSLPYYKFDPTVRALLLSGADVSTAVAASNQTFTQVHPWSWYIGSDAAIDALSATWRVEAAYVSDIPVTTKDFLYTKKAGIDWGAEVEFYPGDKNTRVNLTLSGTEIFNPPPVLDRINIYSFSGMVERPFMRGRWRARLRFLFGLDKKNIYLNPEVAYTGWEPYEIYLDAHYFAGDSVTAGGYYHDNSLITLGWRARF